MPRRLFAVFALTACLITGSASANHAGASCSQSTLLANVAVYPTCSITVSCPTAAGHACNWSLSVRANGIGVVSARMIAAGHLGSYSQCSGVNSCVSSGDKFGALNPGQSFTWECRGDAFAVVFAVSEFMTCAADAV